MAFKGTLDSLGMIEVLQLICMSRKTGCLAVAHPSGEQKKLYFEAGDVTAAISTGAKDRLGFLLVKMGLLSAEQVELARKDEKRTGVKQGTSLIEHGLLTEDQLADALTRQIAEIFYSVMTWHQGSFEFLDNELPGPDVFKVQHSVTDLMMQGTRQLDEWTLIERVFPSLDMVLALSQNREKRGPISLDADEWQLLALIDGKRTIKDVCGLSPFSNFEACKKLLNLHHAGLISAKAADLVVTEEPAPVHVAKPPPIRTVPAGFLAVVRNELTRHVGPIASVLLDECAETLGVPLDKLPVTKVPQLTKMLCSEIDSAEKREQFHEVIVNAAKGHLPARGMRTFIFT